MRFAFLCLIILWPSLALASRVDDLRSLTRSIRAAEEQNNQLRQQIDDLATEMDALETTIRGNLFQATQTLHHLRRMEQSKMSLTFLLSEQSFQDNYYTYKRHQYLYKTLSVSLDAFQDEMDELQFTQKQIANYLNRQENLKAEIDSLLQKIADHYDEAQIEASYQIIQQDYDSLNNLLYDLTKTKLPQTILDQPLVFSLPVSGVIQNQGKGISIETSSNALVTAPAQGIVAYAGDFQNLGKIIVIQHPENYISILRGFDRLFVENGFYIEAEEPIGTVHQQDTKKNAIGSMLYYELRYNESHINPIQKITGL
jgi:septal ring factor EnvC (AmiA/AmiB activator)